MRIDTFGGIALVAIAAVLVGPAQQPPVPEDPGVYAQTDAGTVALKKSFRGIEIAGPMSSGARTGAVVFPIPVLEGVPKAADVTGFLVNLVTVQDSQAAAAQMRFMVGERVREPDYQVMTVRPGKFRTGMYQITSPNLTREWLTTAYAKLTSSRKYRDKQPPATVGLVLNGEMYPVRIDEAVLTAKR
jgi:hypothetical protein